MDNKLYKLKALRRQLNTLRYFLKEYDKEPAVKFHDGYFSLFYDCDPDFYRNTRRCHLKMLRNNIQERIKQTKSVIKKLEREISHYEKK